MSNLLGEVISEQVETGSGELTRELSGSSSWSYFSLTPVGILNIILMLLILSVLGINVLGYTDYVISHYLEPVVNYFGYSLLSITKTTLEKTKKGTKYGMDATLTEIGVLRPRNNDDYANPASIEDSNNEDAVNYEADDTTSEIQRGHRVGKAKNGYCYIGSDRGVRSCVKLSDHQKCMSGDVFPRMDVCVDPSLRY